MALAGGTIGSRDDQRLGWYRAVLGTDGFEGDGSGDGRSRDGSVEAHVDATGRVVRLEVDDRGRPLGTADEVARAAQEACRSAEFLRFVRHKESAGVDASTYARQARERALSRDHGTRSVRRPSATASSADGLCTVQVRLPGGVRGVHLDDAAVRRRTGREVAATVLDALREAYRRLDDQVAVREAEGVRS